RRSPDCKPKRHLGPDLEATDLFPSRPSTDILSIDKPNRLKSSEIACYQTDCTLQDLEELALMGTKIDGPGLSHLVRLASLRRLGLSGTAVRSDDLLHLSSLASLENLSLSNTKIDDSASIHLSKLSTLKKLNVAENRLSDEFLVELSALSSIESLNISGTDVTDRSESVILGFPNLSNFYASDTSMSAECRARIGDFVRRNRYKGYSAIGRNGG
ncbi:hypothetical protein, partial [Rhodopirellula europaea]